MSKKPEELLKLLASARSVAAELQDELSNNFAFRRDVVESSKALTRTLQAPPDIFWDTTLGAEHLYTLRTALAAGWLDAVAKAPADSGVTAEDLASITKSDASMAARLMRLLTAAGSVTEVGLNTYAPNEITHMWCSKGMRAGLKLVADEHAHTLSNMPAFFAKNGYQTPRTVEDGLFAYGYGATLFEFLARHPERQEAFNSFMGAAKTGRKSWLDVYPIEELRVSSESEVMLVDVGGGRGHETTQLASKRKGLDLPGKLILQDQAEVLEQVPAEWRSSFETQAQDFFKPQPASCVHARAYYMRMILHDWPDTACVAILTQLRDAMKTGYSTLLINEIVLPDQGCSFEGAAWDIMMMAVCAGKERTRKDWVELLGQVGGLRMERIWTLEEGGESIIEAVRSK